MDRDRRIDTLTRRETEVLAHLVAGKRNKDIARALGVSELTIQNHLHHVFLKLGVSTRTQAAVSALHLGLVAPSARTNDG